jgi:hypothetical protein
MSQPDFHLHLESYLSLREALGFQMRAERTLLWDFVQFVENAQVSGPIRAQLAVDWACSSSSKCGTGAASQRLSMARGFLAYLRASWPETEVPPRNLVASARRSKPFLFHRGVSSNGAENRVRTSSLLDRCAITIYSRGYGNP